MAERIRIMYLLTGLATGGAQIHAVRVASLLPRAQFDTAVFSLWQEGSEAETKWKQRLETVGIPVHGMLRHGDWRRMLPALWHTVAAFHPHLIHSHSEREDWLNALLRLLHPTRPQAIRTVHIDQQWRTAPRLGPLIDRNLFPYLFSREVAVSQSIRELMLRNQGRRQERVALCYNGMDDESFATEPTGDSPLPPGMPRTGPRIGIVGRLTEQKGHSDLLAALQVVRREQPVQLVIVGEGPLRSRLQTQVEDLMLTGAVQFLGYRQDIPAILSHLDLFVLPSYWEGFPTVLLEAMARGVPVVATNVSGSRELVVDDETGRLIEPGDREALANAIIDLLLNPEKAERLASAAQQRADGFTIQNTASCYEALYRDTITLATSKK
jgi:glycosyltransferase involved in cell wall biosynthesis